ncbi:Uncharacterised protein [Legionella wadsworthii]|uniref:Uncharacterized protein n=1 Tax=Legionella wadsworthii TaxID=28088 RepID=A0A378M129_9GAMM|nr:hypothetical protein [Legionella wadsworthii]STY30116.1 Uncharacterised protein [Legionella wadsworthii]
MPIKYKPFDDLDREIQLKRGDAYIKRNINFDNSSIVNSASRVLRGLGLNNFTSIMVEPDVVGKNFNLSNQLEDKGIDFSKSEPRYVFFSLPTKLGEHSVAIVIDREKKKVHIMDSLGEDYPEAIKQINQCIEDGILYGYDITCGSGTQHKDKNIGGVHSSANIIELIIEDIVPTDGHQLPDRSEETVIRLTGLLSTANDDEAADRQKHDKESAIAFRQKNSLFSVLSKQKPSRDILEFLKELKKETPFGSEFSQRPLSDFLKDFEKKFPNNKLNAEFKKPNFLEIIKKYPPLDGKLQNLLEIEFKDFFHKKSNFKKFTDFITRKSSTDKETRSVKEARKKIEIEIKNSDSKQGEEQKNDRDRIIKLNEIAEDCKKNGISNFPCLDAIIKLTENKRSYIGVGFGYIKKNPAQPHLLSIDGIDLHIDPYAPLNHAYSHVSLPDGLNGIIDSFISQYDRAKKADLLYEWSGNFLGYCLDGQLESASNFLEIRDQPKMSVHKGMEVFLSEYAKDFAEIKFLGKIKSWSDLGNLYQEYQTALNEVNKGHTYLMKLSDIKDESYSSNNIKLLQRQINSIGTAFNSSRIAEFILAKHPEYEFSDGQKLSAELIITYLKEILCMEETHQTTSTYGLVLTHLDTNEPTNPKTAEVSKKETSIQLEKLNNDEVPTDLSQFDTDYNTGPN